MRSRAHGLGASGVRSIRDFERFVACMAAKAQHFPSWPGFVPAIHVLATTRKAWMAGTSQVKPGHDEWGYAASAFISA